MTVLLLTGALSSPGFLTSRNILNVLRQSAALAIVTIGQTILLIAGGFDLSVAATMQLATVMVAELTTGREGFLVPSVLVCLALGAIIGTVNGLIITRRRAAPFMVTLAVSLVVTGARLAYTGGAPGGMLPNGLRPLSQGELFGVPVSVLLVVGLGLVASVTLRKTVFGRQLYALGTNREAARLSGVRVDLLATTTYCVTGLLSALAGLVLAAYIGYADQWLGTGYDLESVAAPVIGGVSLAGGKGGIWGALAGVVFVRLLMNFVVVLRLPVEYQYVLRGGVMILAAMLYFTSRTS